MSDPIHQEPLEQPISAWLASVLAAAARSPHAPDTFYVVARYKPDFGDQTRPFDVQMPIATRESAENLRQQLEQRHGTDYGVFGPFTNEHPLPPGDQAMVAKIVVTTTRGETLNIEGNKYDALFYSYDAVAKFVLPLYVQEYGPDYASTVLKAFNEHPLALMAHLPWSEEVFADSDPTTHGVPALVGPDRGTVYHVTLPPPPPRQTYAARP